jgi:hypothetical protein
LRAGHASSSSDAAAWSNRDSLGSRTTSCALNTSSGGRATVGTNGSAAIGGVTLRTGDASTGSVTATGAFGRTAIDVEIVGPTKVAGSGSAKVIQIRVAIEIRVGVCITIEIVHIV